MTKSGIYKIRNVVNNHSYIGSTIGFSRRKRVHFELLRKKKHHCRYLQNAFNLYGEQNFVFEIVENISDLTLLLEREKWWIENTPDTYNVIQDSVLNHLGIKRSEETKRKISIALTGKHPSEETKQKLREFNMGKKQSQETIIQRIAHQHKPIVQMTLEGSVVREWKSATEAETEGFSRKCIYRCLWGQRPQHKGFRWERKSA